MCEWEVLRCAQEASGTSWDSLLLLAQVVKVRGGLGVFYIVKRQYQVLHDFGVGVDEAAAHGDDDVEGELENLDGRGVLPEGRPEAGEHLRPHCSAGDAA
eukprot:CAMPEP_0173203126 /NCGR_PEP_ID=MMETSP1141-20130122/19350_1 /TAXON_ID=483371 /ORGANISM="non described non described, Strain CCMP2298" /LENGTH=99 /DNA_ID=CAMNT_0014128557 /DNA_START=134 /DNA_END=429 /DNA_ORIENTATION=-